MADDAVVVGAFEQQSHRERLPVPGLAGLVSSVWVQHVAPTAPAYVHRHVPNGGVEIICRIGALPQVSGPITAPRRVTLPPGSTVVGLRLRPGVAGAVLGLPTVELVDVVVEAAEVFGAPALVAAERISGAASPGAAVEALQQLVLGRVAAGVQPDPLVTEALRRIAADPGDDVAALWTALGVAERTFRRAFVATVGVGPKALQRMVRFQGVLARAQFMIAQDRHPSADGLALLAADTGYADQAHLTRECVRLTGSSLRAFLRETERSCAHGHDHAVSFTPILRGRPAVPFKNGSGPRS